MKHLNHNKLRNRQGFTLIEMAVALAIIGILTAMAVPSYNKFVAHQRLNGAARELFADIKQARSLAIRTGTQYVIAFQGPVGSPVTQFQTMIPGTVAGTTYYTFAEAVAVLGSGFQPVSVGSYNLNTLGYLGVTITVPASLPIFQKNGIVSNVVTPSGSCCTFSPSAPANIVLTSSTGEQRIISMNTAGLAQIN